MGCDSKVKFLISGLFQRWKWSSKGHFRFWPCVTKCIMSANGFTYRKESCWFWSDNLSTKRRQEAQLSQKDRAILHVIEYFAKSLKATQLTFLESYRRANGSSRWHVTLRLTVFEIFAVKRPTFRPKISDFWDPGSTAQKGTLRAGPINVPSCKISRRSVAPSLRYLSPNKKRDRKQN